MTPDGRERPQPRLSPLGPSVVVKGQAGPHVTHVPPSGTQTPAHGLPQCGRASFHGYFHGPPLVIRNKEGRRRSSGTPGDGAMGRAGRGPRVSCLKLQLPRGPSSFGTSGCEQVRGTRVPAWMAGLLDT